MILNLVFLIHAALAAALAFLLFFCLDLFSLLATSHALPPGPAGDLARLYARFAALGALLIVIEIGLALTSARHGVRQAVLLALLVLSVLVVAAFGIAAPPFPALRGVVLGVHVALAAAYLLLWVFRPRDI